jgi:hypothetical protein
MENSEFEALTDRKVKDTPVGEVVPLDKVLEIVNSTLWLDSEACYIAKQLLEMARTVKGIKNLRSNVEACSTKEA